MQPLTLMPLISQRTGTPAFTVSTSGSYASPGPPTSIFITWVPLTTVGAVAGRFFSDALAPALGPRSGQESGYPATVNPFCTFQRPSTTTSAPDNWKNNLPTLPLSELETQ